VKKEPHLLGIRHHGPGSAALLSRALDAIDPACVLIEGPVEGDALIAHSALPGMKPPLAMLFHAADEPAHAIFAPFVEYSPEWVAMRWALGRGRAVRFIDWPAAVSLAFGRTEIPSDPVAAADDEEDDAEPDQIEDAVLPMEYRDPLDELAAAAGYSDGESFWNGLVEQGGATSADPLAVFRAIGDAMSEIRDAKEQDGHVTGRGRRDELREAFMRGHVRTAMRETEGEVAVVVGAWHVGGLRRKTTVAEDKALIRDLPKIKVECTWAPWSDAHLSRMSGYGAGVVSPGWYRHLWSLYSGGGVAGVEEFAAAWQARTASALRDEGHGASTASAIEAARLALALAAMRGLSTPGVGEMQEASLSVLCYGEDGMFEQVVRKLYVGSAVGEVDDSVPKHPLIKDFEATCRRNRLKTTESVPTLKLDLRTEPGLAKSTFLHRLDLLGLGWGRLLDADSSRGTFREIWQLHWQPEMAIRLAEAAPYGVTVEQAASAMIVSKAGGEDDVAKLADVVRQALLADLPEAAEDCIDRLQEAAVHVSDVSALMLAVVPLVGVIRYGTARKMPEAALRSLVSALSIEINAGLLMGSQNIEEEVAGKLAQSMRSYDSALSMFEDAALVEGWRGQLAAVAENYGCSPAVAGLALRILHDAGTWAEDRVAAVFSGRVVGEEVRKAAAFLESFLSGSAEILIQDQSLLFVMDDWMAGLDEEMFVETLPLLRRAFSGFDMTGRARILERVSAGRREGAGAVAVEYESDPAFDRALGLLKTILGIAS
jgi:hypothetical protein